MEKAQQLRGKSPQRWRRLAGERETQRERERERESDRQVGRKGVGFYIILAPGQPFQSLKPLPDNALQLQKNMR